MPSQQAIPRSKAIAIRQQEDRSRAGCHRRTACKTPGKEGQRQCLPIMQAPRPVRHPLARSILPTDSAGRSAEVSSALARYVTAPAPASRRNPLPARLAIASALTGADGAWMEHVNLTGIRIGLIGTQDSDFLEPVAHTRSPGSNRSAASDRPVDCPPTEPIILLV